MSAKPKILVLAGVNGAGKSSVGGYQLAQVKHSWFNPDDYVREYRNITHCSQEEANSKAWQESIKRLAKALGKGQNYAFETTLGGTTITKMLREATKTHKVYIWFCGLSSAEKHIERVQLRVKPGGHAIPEQKIRTRYVDSLINLNALIPVVAMVNIYDNSTDADENGIIPELIRIANIENGQLIWPESLADLKKTPDWAKPILGMLFNS